MSHRTSRGLAALFLPLSLAAGLLQHEALGQPACVVAPAPVTAAGGTVALYTGECTLTMPDATAVTMWGFGDSAATIGIPGPAIVVPPGTASLDVTLTNNLPEDVSIVIPGLFRPMQPVVVPDAKGHPRVRSFDAVAPAGGGTQSWSWANPRAGTFLYESGAHPGVQVQMGLYGAATVQPAAGQAYPGVPYDNEVVLVLSEVDARFHAAVAAGRYGAPVPAVLPAGLTAEDYPSSPVNYHPRYFLVNGSPYAPGSAIAAGTGGAPLAANEAILVRFLNAGLRTHVMTLYAPTPASAAEAAPAPYLTVLAEDGDRYPYPKSLYSVFLPAGKTTDSTFSTPVGGSFTLRDRTLALTNGAAVGPAGLQAVLSIGASTGPVASPDAYTMPGNTTLSEVAPGVLANDISATPMSAVLVTTTSHGTLALNADGSFAYTPVTGFAGIDSFTYRATNGASGNVVTVMITVQLPPTAADDAYGVVGGTTLSVPAPGVLGNDSMPLGVPVSAVLVTGPTKLAGGSFVLNADGSFSYWTKNLTAMTDSFTYRAHVGTLDSAPATVTIAIAAHPAPVAHDDAFSAAQRTTFAYTPVVLNVLANDTATAPATLVPSSVTILSQPSRGGTVSVGANGTIRYTPKRLFRGSDVFTYRVKDDLGATSNSGRVTVNVK